MGAGGGGGGQKPLALTWALDFVSMSKEGRKMFPPFEIGSERFYPVLKK